MEHVLLGFVVFNTLCLLMAIGGNLGPVELVVIMTGIVTVGLLVIGGWGQSRRDNG